MVTCGCCVVRGRGSVGDGPIGLSYLPGEVVRLEILPRPVYQEEIDIAQVKAAENIFDGLGRLGSPLRAGTKGGSCLSKCGFPPGCAITY